MIADLAGQGTIQVLVAGAFCGLVYLCATAIVGRKYVAYIAIPAVIALQFPLSMLYGPPALVLGGIASFLYWVFSKARRWYWHVPIVAALLAGGLYVSFSPDLDLYFWGLPVLGTLVLYPLVNLGIRGEKKEPLVKESIFFFAASAATCSVWTWGFPMAFGGAETTLSEVRSVVVQALSPYQISTKISDQVVYYVDIVLVTLVILGCLVLADFMSRSRPFEALTSRIHRD